MVVGDASALVAPVSQEVALERKRAYVSVLSEFKKSFPAPAQVSKGVDDTSYVARCVQANRLQPESQVYFLLQGLHGIVYVHSNRKQKGGRPVFGKVYSNFLFDSYRRSFKYGGVASAVGQTWQSEREAATTKSFNDAIAQLDDIKLLATYRAKLQDTLERSREEMLPVVEALTTALHARRGKHYPTIDLFLGEVVQEVAAAWPLQEGKGRQGALNGARDLVADCFKSIVRGNVVSRNAPREAWLLDAPDSWRVRRDHSAGLMFENIALKQDPFFYGYSDILPNVEGFDAPKNVSDKRKKWVKRLMTPELQPIAHVAVRDAAHQCVLGKWYFDERLQRNMAIDADTLAAKLSDVKQANVKHNELARRRTIAALSVAIPIKNPQLAKRLQTQRNAQRDILVKRTDFPVFADVPWRVGRREGLKLEKKHFAFFSTIPFMRGKHIGNCNSIAFAFLDLARKSQGLQSEAHVHHIKGRWRLRAVGSRHSLRIPVPKAL